jgi:hypothetical protein
MNQQTSLGGTTAWSFLEEMPQKGMGKLGENGATIVRRCLNGGYFFNGEILLMMVEENRKNWQKRKI